MSESIVAAFGADISDVAIVTIELLDWPGDEAFPATLAIPLRLTRAEMDHGWVWPNDKGLQEIAARVVNRIDFDILSDSPPWEIRGVRWMRRDPLALLPGETLMTIAQVNEMFARMRQQDECDNHAMRGI